MVGWAGGLGELALLVRDLCLMRVDFLEDEVDHVEHDLEWVLFLVFADSFPAHLDKGPGENGELNQIFQEFLLPGLDEREEMSEVSGVDPVSVHDLDQGLTVERGFPFLGVSEFYKDSREDFFEEILSHVLEVFELSFGFGTRAGDLGEKGRVEFEFGDGFFWLGWGWGLVVLLLGLELHLLCSLLVVSLEGLHDLVVLDEFRSEKTGGVFGGVWEVGVSG